MTAREQKELERQARWDEAQREVAAFTQAVERLQTLHTQGRPPIDWQRQAVALPPPEPPRAARHELAAALKAARRGLGGAGGQGEITAGRQKDGEAEAVARREHEQTVGELERKRAFAQRVLRGEAAAYREVLARECGWKTMGLIGTAVTCSVEEGETVSAKVTVYGREVLPAEVKSLTATGKVTTRAWNQGMRHEVYQDYVCACALRVAREILAVLPVQTVVVTALVPETDEGGGGGETPVLSAIFPRARMALLDWGTVDPSDAVAFFENRGEVRAAQKTGRFSAVEPFAASGSRGPERKRPSLKVLREMLRARRREWSGGDAQPLATNAEVNTSLDENL